MLALTIGGQAGAGAPEIGRKVANQLGGQYVEHLALRRLARHLGATAEAVTRKEFGFSSRRDRFLSTLELLFNRIGWYGADFAADGYSSLAYTLEKPGQKTMPAEISDDEYKDGVYETAKKFVDDGKDLILVKRAGCVTLKDEPSVLHLGLFSPWDRRVDRMAKRLGTGVAEAEDIVTGLERARAGWFKKIADADPADPALYGLTFETGRDLTDEQITDMIIHNAVDVQLGQTS